MCDNDNVVTDEKDLALNPIIRKKKFDLNIWQIAENLF
jgi:hypothetical protein